MASTRRATTPTPEFADEPFFPAKHKATVLRAWRAFLRSGMNRDKLTQKLYEHLTHCGHLAYNDCHGFYVALLADPRDRDGFITKFLADFHPEGQFVLVGRRRACYDLNERMALDLAEYERQLREQCRSERIATLQRRRAAAEAELAELHAAAPAPG